MRPIFGWRFAGRPLQRLASIAAMGLLVGSAAWPQETEPEEEPPPKLSKFELKLGYRYWALRGNEHKYRQYATPVEGLYFDRVEFAPFWGESGENGSFLFRGSIDEDYVGSTRVTLLNGSSTLGANFQFHRFFDATPTVIESSSRNVRKAYLHQELGAKVGITASTRTDFERKNFEAPQDPLNQRTTTNEVALKGEVLGGFASASYTQWRYWDRLEALPDVDVRHWQGAYTRDLSPNLIFDGAVGRTEIRQQGGARADVENWSLAGQWSLSDTTRLGFGFRRQTHDLPQVQSTFVRERNESFARLDTRIGAWKVSAAYRRVESERVRDDHSFVDVPIWNTVDARISGRICDGWRLSLRGQRQSLQGRPAMTTSDPRSLYFDDRTLLQAKIDGGSETLFGYAAWTRRENELDARSVNVRSDQLSFGATWLYGDRLEVFGEHNLEVQRARSEVAGPDALGLFFPDSRATTFGVNWIVDDQTNLSASYTFLATDNDNPLSLRDGNYVGDYLSLSLLRRMPNGDEFGLSFAPWRYSDKIVSQMAFDTLAVGLTYSRRF
ncbi:MAG: hypothetical protein QY327_04345 [Fimbriimonadaceae bacterium]|nr:MAG: hypothetical protein UZ18_ATM001001735 [Armatimonadetes bacterium OLB18]WKZ81135.1 MAG: hypothetical protein QY327_04345 [Fimbriimonadaceae bacterium]